MSDIRFATLVLNSGPTLTNNTLSLNKETVMNLSNSPSIAGFAMWSDRGPCYSIGTCETNTAPDKCVVVPICSGGLSTAPNV